MGLEMTLYKSTPLGNFKIASWYKANAIHGFFERELQGGAKNGKYTAVPRSVFVNLMRTCKSVKAILENADTYIKPVIVSYGYEVTTKKTFPLYTECHIYCAEAAYKAAELLPPMEGCFFGPAEICEEFYFANVLRTIAICADVLQNIDFNKEVVFYFPDY